MDMGTVVALIKGLAPKADPAVIEQAVTDWLDDHPEATTTVQDGSITEEKLAADVVEVLSNLETDVSDVKNAIHGISIIQNVSTEKTTVFDSANAYVSSPKVYGITRQDRVFGYDICPFEKSPNWINDNPTVSEMTVKQEEQEVDIVITSATNKVVFKPADAWFFTAEEIAEIEESGTFTLVYEIESNVANNYDFRPHFEINLGSVNKSKFSQGIGKGTGTKALDVSSVIASGFDNIKIWWEIQRTGGNTFAVDDYFKLKKFEVKIDTTVNKYVINNSNNFTVGIGETSANVPYTLRGVPFADGSIIIDDVPYVADELDATTGKITRRIDTAIDSCISAKLTDYSPYILETPTEEDASSTVCNALKALKTEYLETEIDGDGGAVSFNYLADTKTYIDKSSGQGFVTPEQYGAVGDGVTDDTEALRTMFNSGAEVIKLSDNKNYMVSEQIVIGGVDELTIFGNGSTIKRIAGKISDLSNDKFVLSTDTESTGRKSITIQNIHICANASEFTDDVNSYGYNLLPGLRIYGYDTVRLDGVEISDTLTGMGYLIQQAIHGIIENCYIHDIGQPWNVKVIFPNYMCGGGVIEIKNGAYVGSTLSIKNSRYERITASCHGSKTQYAEFIGNTYVECQDVIVEQTDTNPVDDVSVNKHRLMKNNHMIRCAHSLFSCSSAMSVENDTTGKTVVIEGNVIEDAGDLNFYDLTSSPRTYTRVAKRMLALVNDNNNVKAPYEKVVIKNNYVSYAKDLDESPVVTNVFSDLLEFNGNTIICPENDGNATIGSVSANGVIVENNNLFDGCAIGNVGIWSRLIADGNVFTYEGIIKDSQFGLGAAQNIMDIKNNKLLNDAKTLLNIKSNNGKLRMIGNTAKYLITSDEANCRGSGIVVDNVADTEFKDTTNTGSYSVTGTIAYTMS